MYVPFCMKLPLIRWEAQTKLATKHRNFKCVTNNKHVWTSYKCFLLSHKSRFKGSLICVIRMVWMCVLRHVWRLCVLSYEEIIVHVCADMHYSDKCSKYQIILINFTFKFPRERPIRTTEQSKEDTLTSPPIAQAHAATSWTCQIVPLGSFRWKFPYFFCF